MSTRRSSDSRGLRLDAYLARAGLASRREARRLIRRGGVRVDGVVCRESERRISAERVSLDHRTVPSPTVPLDLILHKPRGVACGRDPREAPLVFDLLANDARSGSLHVAGRLDRDTTGLLVLSSDGDLIHRLTHPSRKLPKRYRIGYRGQLDADAVAACRAGLRLAGDASPTRPATLVLEAPGRASLVLREGRRHQVRRMIRALGAEVVALHRDRVGGLDLPPDLAPGDFRPLAAAERACLLTDSSL